MSDFKRINQPRVDAALDKIEMIVKSAKANKVSREEYLAILDPIYRATNPGPDPTIGEVTRRIVEGPAPLREPMPLEIRVRVLNWSRTDRAKLARDILDSLYHDELADPGDDVLS